MNLISSSLFKIFYFSTIFLLAFVYIDFQLHYYPKSITQDFYYQVWMLENWKDISPSGLSDNFYSIISYLNFLLDPTTFLKTIASISTTITTIAILYKSRNILNGIFKVLLIFSIPTIAISYYCNTRFCLAQSIVLLIFVRLDLLKEKNNFLNKLKIVLLSIFSSFIHIFTLPLLLISLLPNQLNFSKNINNFIFKLKNIFRSFISGSNKLKLIILLSLFILFCFFIMFLENIDFYFAALISKITWYCNNFFRLPEHLTLLLFPIISIGILYQNLRKNKLVLMPSKILIFMYLSIPLYLMTGAQTSRYLSFGLIATIAFMPKIPIPSLCLLLFYTSYLSFIYY